MKLRDAYHKWVKWSDADQTYIGMCPDVITGIHGDDPIRLYGDLCQVVEEVIEHLQTEGRPLPTPCVDPTREVV